MKTMTLVTTLATLILTSLAGHAQPLTDLPGVKDLEDLPRVANTKIVATVLAENLQESESPTVYTEILYTITVR